MLLTGSVLAERLPVRSYSTADGLAHNNINRIVRDSQGFLWFCTPNGLSRFDGYAFRTFGTESGLPAAAVNDLLETSEGDYWVATDDGLAHLDDWKRSGDPVARQPEVAGLPTGLPVIVAPGNEPRSRAITVLVRTADKTIWVGTRNGLFRLARGSDGFVLQPVDVGLSNEFPEQRMIADLTEDRHGTLWIGTPVGLYRRWPDGSTARYTTKEGLPGQYVTDLLHDRDGSLWIATRESGFFRLDTTASHASPVVTFAVTKADSLPSPWVPQLFEASDGRLWAATSQGLVELLAIRGGAGPKVRLYTVEQGLTDGYIGAISQDLGGSMWLGTGGAGALKLTAGGFTTYGAHDYIASVNDIFEDSTGAVCLRAVVVSEAYGSTFTEAPSARSQDRASIKMDGLGCLNESRFEWFAPAALKLWGWVKEGITLRTRNGEWWIGSQQGVLRYAPTGRFDEVRTARPLAVYKTEDGLPAIQTFRLFEDSRGDVWISTISSPTRGLSRFERRTGRLQDMGHLAGLPSPINDLARSFAEDPAGNVWIAFNSGLARYTNGAISFFSTPQGLPAGPILGMLVDRSGRLWLASERGGLIRIDDPSAAAPAFVSYTTANGLSSNSLAAIVEDRDGFLYVGGGNGIDRIDTTSGRVRHFTQADGLGPGIVKAAFRDRRGVLWFGMSNGLARLDPTPEKGTVAPPILISNLRVAGAPYRVSPFGERRISLAELPSDDHQLEVEFVGLGFGPGEVLRYQYKLDGAREWSPLSSRRAVTYASLSPGRYTFAVQAVNSDGVPSPSPATVTFTILPPFWQRWWFLAGAAIALGFVVNLAFRYRLARLLEVANMRTHIATDLHDDIGANLTRIALLSEVARRTREEAPLEAIATIARESVSSMGDIVWAINPRRESLLDLTRRMRQHAAELFTMRGIDLRFEAPSGGDARRLGADIRRDLLLIFKEAINNAARHSQCTAVEITLRVERGKLLLTVADDGIGFEPPLNESGHGLTSMRRRAARIHGLLQITPGATSGTVVALTVPL